jgi:hypothetical protein
MMHGRTIAIIAIRTALILIVVWGIIPAVIFAIGVASFDPATTGERLLEYHWVFGWKQVRALPNLAQALFLTTLMLGAAALYYWLSHLGKGSKKQKGALTEYGPRCVGSNEYGSARLIESKDELFASVDRWEAK